MNDCRSDVSPVNNSDSDSDGGGGGVQCTVWSIFGVRFGNNTLKFTNSTLKTHITVQQINTV